MEMKKQLRNLRVLHSAAIVNPSSGILSQMLAEQQAANACGIQWRTRMYCSRPSVDFSEICFIDHTIDSSKLSGGVSQLMAWVKLRWNYHQWLLAQQDDLDVFLLRYYVHDPFQLLFVLRCSKPVYFVHHTLEIQELALSGGFKGFIRSFLEKWLGRFTLPRAAGLIGVTEEIADYENKRIAGKYRKKSYVYPNGIVYEEVDLGAECRSGVPEMLFVANFAPWHGLDLLLEQVVKSDKDFVLHLVGNIPDSLLALTEDRRVVLHGHLGKRDIHILARRCWIGLSAFAQIRTEMKQACPLKVREYLMLGLPACGDYDDVFPEGFQYYRNTGCDLEKIIDFSWQVKEISKETISKDSRRYIEKAPLLTKLYDFLCDRYALI